MYVQNSDIEVAQVVVWRLKLSAVCFFTAWTCYPILWLLSSQGMCLVADSLLDSCKCVCGVCGLWVVDGWVGRVCDRDLPLDSLLDQCK